ncbi:acyltransferase family protein [Williamsia serinedens]|uniref:Peptidoglycan/LPS O-acetylase OafA/YrhL, contains acyltransferase and SGNH-hydrolase domains n=1 Tax=Williamsia serinedens TaxID=391736 RepID=A0ABT1H666_9NOCA|nr:acyltransferase [Williamsia serinedens]MCP2162718.1 Peptidoglycan/LPS O-acetylase OafA/YrhL, contains acyltransferase and SGNH-hydrolase domains [Williamsia serinedens]
MTEQRVGGVASGVPVEGGPSPALPTPAARRHKRIRGLDGPRGIACVCILVVHVAGHYSVHTAESGKLQILGQALIFFFALSGFLLYLPILRALFADRDRQPDVRSFVVHRVLRIMPCYLVVFLIANFVLQAVFVRNAQQALVLGSEAGTGMITDPVTFLANIFLVQTYVPGLIQTGINPSWSLTLEYAFYISLPLVGWGLFALRRRRGTSPMVLALIAPIAFCVIGVVGTAVADAIARAQGIDDIVAANFGPNWSAVILRSFLGGAQTFTFGMIAAVLFVAVESGALSARFAVWARRVSAILLLPALLVMLVLLVLPSNQQVVATSFASGLIIAIIVLPLAHDARSRIAEVVDWKPFEYLGRISLSMYLWHFPLLMLLGRWGVLGGDTWAGLGRNLLIVFAATVLCSAITYRFVEKPAIDLARRVKTR